MILFKVLIQISQICQQIQKNKTLNIIINQMDTQYSPEQYEKIFHVCSALHLDDVVVATSILQQYGWNSEKAISQVVNGQQQHKIQQIPFQQKQQYQQYHDDYQYQDMDNQYEYDYGAFNQMDHKRQIFQQSYASFPLTKTTSATSETLQRKLQGAKQLGAESKHNLRQYHEQLYQNADKLTDRLLLSQPQHKKKLYENKKQIQINKKFIAYLHENYHPKINFTFGTFFKNLIRSYLEKKFLLVYVHKHQFSYHRVIQSLLSNSELAQFANRNCVCYGMFDSSEDYEIVQKYLPISEVPAFLLFKLNKKTLSQKFMAKYIVFNKENDVLLQWLAKEIGIPIKKKTQNMQKKQFVEPIQTIPMNLIQEQNLQYEEMAKLYIIQRQRSKVQKQQIAKKKQHIDTTKNKFETEPQMDSQKVIQFKIRMPVSGKSKFRRFLKDDLIADIFDYVDCYGREQFEDQYGDFDLTQTFPFISLKTCKQKKIGIVFPDSDMENIIVKQL